MGELLNTAPPPGKDMLHKAASSSRGVPFWPRLPFLEPSGGFWLCKLEIHFPCSSGGERATYLYCWCTRPSRSLWCHFPDSSRWSWWATPHTCSAGSPWTAAVRSGQKRSGRTLSGSSHLTASSRTELGHPQWSSGLRRQKPQNQSHPRALPTSPSPLLSYRCPLLPTALALKQGYFIFYIMRITMGQQLSPLSPEVSIFKPLTFKKKKKKGSFSNTWLLSARKRFPVFDCFSQTKWVQHCVGAFISARPFAWNAFFSSPVLPA